MSNPEDFNMSTGGNPGQIPSPQQAVAPNSIPANLAPSQSPIQNVFENEIGGVVYRMPKLNTYEARKMQVRVAKVVGAPFITSAGMIQQDENGEPIMVSDSNTIVSMFNSIDPEVSVDLIKDLCELTYNGTTNRKTNYLTDFDSHDTKDLELAAWVIKEQFGNFLTAFMQSNIGAETLGLLGMNAT